MKNQFSVGQKVRANGYDWTVREILSGDILVLYRGVGYMYVLASDVEPYFNPYKPNALVRVVGPNEIIDTREPS
jgi:hypothetical protein